MNHKLTAFEFIAATNEPTIVQLFRGDELLAQFAFIDWIAVDLRSFDFQFENQSALIINGEGLGHPYWDADVPPWMVTWDPRQEAARIKMIKQAAARQLNAMRLVVTES